MPRSRSSAVAAVCALCFARAGCHEIGPMNLPDRGSGGSVVRVESPDGVFPTLYPYDTMSIPTSPRWLGDHVRVVFVGTGFFDGMRLTLQQANETQCSEMYNMNRNDTWEPTTWQNQSAEFAPSLPSPGPPQATPTPTLTLTHTQTPSETRTLTGTATDTFTRSEPQPSAPPVGDYGNPLRFYGVHTPLAVAAVAPDGSTAEFHVPMDPYFVSPRAGLTFCLEVKHVDEPTATLTAAGNDSATETLTPTVDPPWVDFTTDSKVFLDTYQFWDMVGPFGSDLAFNGSTRAGRPPYTLPLGFADDGAGFKLFGSAPGSATLRLALSATPFCGNLTNPVGWGLAGETHRFFAEPSAVAHPLNPPAEVVERPMDLVAAPGFEGVFDAAVGPPETMRTEGLNASLTLCVKAENTSFGFFHPLRLSGDLGPLGGAAVLVRLEMAIEEVWHDGEVLAPVFTEEGKPWLADGHNNTIRFLGGHGLNYTVEFVAVGLTPLVTVGINATCGGNSIALGGVSSVTVGPPSGGVPPHSRAGNVSSVSAVSFTAGDLSFANWSLCFSLVGPELAVEYSVYSGLRVTQYLLKGIHTEAPLLEEHPLYRWYYGATGYQHLPSENLEAHVRVKFEGGDGVGAAAGDEWPLAECTGDESAEHAPSFVEPTPAAGGARILLRYEQSAAWRTDAFVCVALYPHAHSRYTTTRYRAEFVSFFTSAEYEAEAILAGGRIYLYSGYPTVVHLRGTGLWDHFRWALAPASSLPCTANLAVFDGVSQPGFLSNVSAVHDEAEFHVPYSWVSRPTSTGLSRVCMSAAVNGSDFRLDTTWRFAVMALNTIGGLTNLQAAYGVNGKVYNLRYVNGEIGNQIAFARDCSAVRRFCGGEHVTAAFCAAGPGTDESAVLSQCRRNALGPGGYSDLLALPSAVPTPGAVLFIYECQSARFAVNLKVCASPNPWGLFKDTGLRFSFLIKIASVEIDAAVIPVYSDIKVLKNTQPTVKLVGTGLYSHMRLAAMPNCTGVPYYEYTSESNASWIASTVPWRFVDNSDTDDGTELQFVTPLAASALPVRSWDLCLSEYAGVSEYPADFTIETDFTFTVVELLTVNGSSHLSLPYGERAVMRLLGHNLTPGMQLKFGSTCSTTAPTMSICQGTFGGRGATGCRIVADNVCYTVPTTGIAVDGLWFLLLQTATSQHAFNLKLCLAVRSSSPVFYNTGLTADFLIKLDQVHVFDKSLTPYETVLVHQGFTSFPGEEIAANDPRYGRTVELQLNGRGYRDTFRLKLQSECGTLNSSEGGSPMTIYPASDVRVPSSCGLGDTQATVYLRSEHTGVASDASLEFCLTPFGQGASFAARTYIYFGVVSLQAVSIQGGARAVLPYGFSDGLTFYGTALMPFMRWRLAYKKVDGVCQNSAGAPLPFEVPLPLVRVSGGPRCQPGEDAGVCAPYSGVGDRRHWGGSEAEVAVTHTQTFRQVENQIVCLSIYGDDRYYATSLTMTSTVTISSVESYAKHHYPGNSAHNDMYVYTRYPDHVITLHGKGFFDHHRVAFMKGSCGALNPARPRWEVVGPFAVVPVALPNRTALPTDRQADGAERTAALVAVPVGAGNLTGLTLCYSVFSGGDAVNAANFSLSVRMRLTTVAVDVLEYVGSVQPPAEPVTIRYGKTKQILLGGQNLIPDSTTNMFLFNINDDCSNNITTGVATPMALTYISIRDPVTQRLSATQPAVNVPVSITRQYAQRKLCFSPYQMPYHHFLDTGYRVFVECTDPAQPCSPQSPGICDRNATLYHQYALGCACTFEERTNYSCSLETRVPCNASSTCSGNGVCVSAYGLCTCDDGFYGPNCQYCDAGIGALAYTDSVKHAVVSFAAAFGGRGPAVAGWGGGFSCGGVIPEADWTALGGPECIWTSPTVLHVFLGYEGAVRTPGHTLRVVPGALDAACEGEPPSPQIIPAARIVYPPVPVVIAPATIGPCDGVTLDASLSFGAGGDLVYGWAVSNSSADHDYHAPLDQHLTEWSRSAADIPIVDIPAAFLPLGRYLFTLRVATRVTGVAAEKRFSVEKIAPASPLRLVVVLPQRSPFSVLDADPVASFGPVEVSSAYLSPDNEPAGEWCPEEGFAAMPVNKRYVITWSLRWLSLPGDTYVESGELWVEGAGAGTWRDIPILAQHQNKPVLYLPMTFHTNTGVVEALPVDRSSVLSVAVQLYDADAAGATPSAVGFASVDFRRERTFAAFFHGGNRTVVGSFTLRLFVRLPESSKHALVRTRWWCNDTAAGGASLEAACPEPLADIPRATRHGLDDGAGAGRVVFHLGPGSTAAVPLGSYLFTVSLYVPSLTQTLSASCLVTVAPPPPLGGFLDVGINPSNSSVGTQLASHSATFTLTAVVLSEKVANTLYTYKWSLWLSESRSISLPGGTDAETEVLLVPAYAMQPGGTYYFRVLVREVQSGTGLVLRQASASHLVRARLPPHGGRLRLGAGSLLLAEGWTVERERFPLAYKFVSEVGCGHAAGQGCACCSMGNRVVHADGCVDVCTACTCSLLADWSYRSFLAVTVPRTLEQSTVKYSLLVSDRLGVVHGRDLTLPTIVEDGSVGTPVPSPPDTEEWMAQVDVGSLAAMKSAVDRQDVGGFLLVTAQLVANLQLLVRRQFAQTVCKTATELPYSDADTPTKSATPTVSLLANGTETREIPRDPGTYTVSLTGGKRQWGADSEPSRTETRSLFNDSTATATLRPPDCTTIFPDLADLPRLPFFPKIKSAAFELKTTVEHSLGLLSALSSATEKIRLVDLLVTATSQPAFVSRSSATVILSLVDELLHSSTYLNVGQEFHDAVASILGQLLSATVTLTPDDFDPTDPLTTADPLVVDAIRAEKKEQ
eukprot:gene17620-27129_t